MEKLLQQIDEKIEASTGDLIADTVALVNINSEQGEPAPGAPFGKGPRKVLDAVLNMAEKEGFYTEDYGVGVVSAALKNTQPDLGIWLHGDVVPAGEGWIYPPYHATVYQEKYVIGRGVTDNKGQLAAIFHLLKIFKEMGIALKYNPALYVGSNEEVGMKDMVGIDGNPDAKGFVNVCSAPKLSLVPDSGFPLGYGARGSATYKLKSRTPLHGFTLTAGKKETPGLATAVFDTTDFPSNLPDCTVEQGEKTTVTSFSPPRHSADPDPNGNMITQITSALLNANAVSEEDRYILEFFRDVSSDIYGKTLGIHTESNDMKPTTVCAQAIDFSDGYCELVIRVRYPIEITYEALVHAITESANAKGFDVTCEKGHEPYIYDANSEIAKMLTDTANSVTGDNGKPEITGSTYAHYLPNAYVYGMNGCLIPEDFPKGHGEAHGIDECVSVERLKRAMRIYARALLNLNDMKW